MSDNHYPEILQDLRDQLVTSLTEQGIDAQVAYQCAYQTTEQIRKDWGGLSIYICKGQDFELSQRDLNIWSEFTGHNHQALCRKYDITLQWLYKIIKAQRKKAQQDSQRDLFLPGH